MYSQASALLRKGNFDDALSQVTQLLSKKPDNTHYQCLKGKALEKMNRNEEANQIYEEVLTKNPNDP